MERERRGPISTGRWSVGEFLHSKQTSVGREISTSKKDQHGPASLYIQNVLAFARGISTSKKGAKQVYGSRLSALGPSKARQRSKNKQLKR